MSWPNANEQSTEANQLLRRVIHQGRASSLWLANKQPAGTGPQGFVDLRLAAPSQGFTQKQMAQIAEQSQQPGPFKP